MPQREAGIDFQQMQRARLVALEIELGDAAQPEPLDDIAALPLHVRRGGDFERRGVAVRQRKSANLAAGELAGDAAALVDVAVIAFDLRFGAGDQLLRQKIDAGIEQLRPQCPQRIDVLHFKRLAQSKNVVPALQAGQRLDDDGKGKVEMVGLDGDGMKLARWRHRQAVALRQVLEPRLVEQVFDQRRVGDDEAKRFCQPFAMARNQQKLRVFFIEQHRLFALGAGEAFKRIE